MFHLQLLQNIVYIPHIVQYILVACLKKKKNFYFLLEYS